jgi:hypothetical protein
LRSPSKRCMRGREEEVIWRGRGSTSDRWARCMCGRTFLYYSVELNGELFPGRDSHPLGPALSRSPVRHRQSRAPHLLPFPLVGHHARPVIPFPSSLLRRSSPARASSTDILARMRWTGLELIWIDPPALLVINGILRLENDWRHRARLIRPSRRVGFVF